jgi:uncharacterized lipoprotein YddW (UPF0748 family)
VRPTSVPRGIALLAAAVLLSTAPSPPARNPIPPPIVREFRAAWVTPLEAGGIPDWPSRAGLSSEQQQAELRALLDRARDVGLNSVILHVRTAGDALYPSKEAPWSAFLSGRSGVAPKPAYDPLAFAVEEAHARGLQLHAWFNPFRAILPNIKSYAAPTHVTKVHASWIRTYGSQRWIDPGIPAARAAVLRAVMEVVDGYDVDGVHIDDYFYPYREQRTVKKKVGKKTVRVREDIPFPDDASWKTYGAGKGFATRADWRRANVDTFVEELYRSVKARKSWVAVGISPFGIWRSGTPEGVTGLDAYGEIYADSRKWLREGWLDYLAPQLYWPIAGVQQRFVALDGWWRTQNPHNRHIWPGLFTSQTEVGRTPWPIAEIPAQITQLRDQRVQSPEQPGHIHFRLGALVGRTPLGNDLRAIAYATTALVPAMPWLGNAPPASPIPKIENGALTIVRGDTSSVSWWAIQTLAATGEWSTALKPATASTIALDSLRDWRGGRIAITAIDRAGQASGLAILEVSESGWRVVTPH